MATVGFGLESANVVGYNGAALRGGNQAAGAGASFVNVDETDLTLGNLKVVGYNAEDGRISNFAVILFFITTFPSSPSLLGLVTTNPTFHHSD